MQTRTVKEDDTSGVKDVLVMKVAGFAPPGDYKDAWTGFLNDAKACLSEKVELVIVDVMQNGGGYVCLGTFFNQSNWFLSC